MVQSTVSDNELLINAGKELLDNHGACIAALAVSVNCEHKLGIFV